MWHDSYVLVVLALAALAVLAGVVAVAMGYGGELAEFAPDVPPLDLPEATRLGAADFMALHLPVSLVGYHTQSVDETLNRVANALSERDTRIAVLEHRVDELLAGRLQARQELRAGPPAAPRTEHRPRTPEGLPEPPEAPGISEAPGSPESPESLEVPKPPEALEVPEVAGSPESPESREISEALESPSGVEGDRDGDRPRAPGARDLR